MGVLSDLGGNSVFNDPCVLVVIAVEKTKGESRSWRDVEFQAQGEQWSAGLGFISKWSWPDGLKIGISFEEIVRLNQVEAAKFAGESFPLPVSIHSAPAWGGAKLNLGEDETLYLRVQAFPHDRVQGFQKIGLVRKGTSTQSFQSPQGFRVERGAPQASHGAAGKPDTADIDTRLDEQHIFQPEGRQSASGQLAPERRRGVPEGLLLVLNVLVL